MACCPGLGGIVAVSVFVLMTAWGEVLFASMLTTDSTCTPAIGLQEYATQVKRTGTS